MEYYSSYVVSTKKIYVHLRKQAEFYKLLASRGIQFNKDIQILTLFCFLLLIKWIIKYIYVLLSSMKAILLNNILKTWISVLNELIYSWRMSTIRIRILVTFDKFVCCKFIFYIFGQFISKYQATTINLLYWRTIYCQFLF